MLNNKNLVIPLNIFDKQKQIWNTGMQAKIKLVSMSKKTHLIMLRILLTGYSISYSAQSL